jgi:hypothetical protein
MAILSDHEPDSRGQLPLPESDEGAEGDAVIFSMVCDADAGRIRLTNGLPCRSEHREIDQAEVI